MFIPVRNIKSINRFRWNVELRLRLTGLNYRINFAFTQTWRYNTKLHGPNKRMGKNKKWDSLVLIRACFCMIGRYHGIPCFHFFCFFFCLEATVKTNTWMRTISVTVMVIISKVLFWKSLDFSYVQSSFSEITRHLDNGIWNILYSWRFYGHRST